MSRRTSLIKLRTAGMLSAVISFKVYWLDRSFSVALIFRPGSPSSKFKVERQLT